MARDNCGAEDGRGFRSIDEVYSSYQLEIARRVEARRAVYDGGELPLERKTANLPARVSAALDLTSYQEGINLTDALAQTAALGALVKALTRNGHRLKVVDPDGNEQDLITP